MKNGTKTFFSEKHCVWKHPSSSYWQLTCNEDFAPMWNKANDYFKYDDFHSVICLYGNIIAHTSSWYTMSGRWRHFLCQYLSIRICVNRWSILRTTKWFLLNGAYKRIYYNIHTFSAENSHNTSHNLGIWCKYLKYL